MVDVNADHLAGGEYTPQMANNFTVEIGGLDSLRLAVKGFPFPKFTVEKGTLNWQNEQVHYAQAVSFEEVTMVLYDFVDADVAQTIYDWYTDIYNPETGVISPASNYKKRGTLIEHGPDGSSERRWTMKGMFPVSVDLGEGDMDSRGEPINISVTLSVDKVVRG